MGRALAVVALALAASGSGVAWGAPAPTVVGQGAVDDVDAAVGGAADAAVVWAGADGMSAARRAPGGAWAVDALGTGWRGGAPTVVVTGQGRTVVTWRRSPRPSTTELVSAVAERGAPFSAPRVLERADRTTGTWPSDAALAALPDGTVLATYTRGRSSRRQELVVAALAPGRGTFGRPRELETTLGQPPTRNDRRAPAIAAAGRGALLAWAGGWCDPSACRGRRVRLLRLDRRGRPIGRRATLPDPTAATPTLAPGPSGSVVVGWWGNPSGFCAVAASSTRCAARRRIGTPHGSPTFAADGRGTVAVGVLRRTGDGLEETRQLLTAQGDGALRTTPLQIGALTSTPPDVAVGPGGRVLAVEVQHDSGQVRLLGMDGAPGTDLGVAPVGTASIDALAANAKGAIAAIPLAAGGVAIHDL